MSEDTWNVYVKDWIKDITAATDVPEIEAVDEEEPIACDVVVFADDVENIEDSFILGVEIDALDFLLEQQVESSRTIFSSILSYLNNLITNTYKDNKDVKTDLEALALRVFFLSQEMGPLVTTLQTIVSAVALEGEDDDSNAADS
jgi:hypothetical protein